MAAPLEITSQQLMRLIGTPDCPAIVDVQIDEDFTEDPYLIPTAIRHSHKDLEGLVNRLNGQPAIVYCQKGLKLSQGVVAWLRSAGLSAEYLNGGMYAWSKAGLPRIPSSQIPMKDGHTEPWVTRHRPKIDRIACPWLLKRFVDRDARILFVSPSEVMNVAEKFDATPFDIEKEYWSHRGTKCTFDTMLTEFNLHFPALDRMADVIRAADTDTQDQCPEAAGLLAISVGLSRQYKDDHQQLAAGLHIYDALYRWARDGQAETHKWPHGDRS